MPRIKQIVRRMLSTAMDAAWPQRVDATLAQLNQEIVETKAGVSALQGESSQALSHIIVLRQELHHLAGVLRAQASAAREAPGEGDPADLEAYPALSQSILALPLRLDRLAMRLKAMPIGNPALRMNANALARHYTQMSDLVARHWINARRIPADPYPADDLTFEEVKRLRIFIPGADVDVATQEPGLPWRPFWSDPDCACFLVLGNATAGNHGGGNYTSAHEVYSFDYMRLRCNPAADPLLGASGRGSSIWSRLGDRLIDKGLTRRVLFVPLALAGSQITDWIPGGSCYPRTALALSRLRKQLVSAMLPFSAVLWHLDRPANLSDGSYRSHCHDVVADLRANGVFAPIFVARANENSGASRKSAPGGKAGVEPTLADAASGLFDGPDLDSIDDAATIDGERGGLQIEVDRAAELWLEVLAEHWLLLGRPGD